MQLTVAIKVDVIYFYNWLNKYCCLNSQVVTSALRRFHRPLLGQNAISLVLPQTPGKKEQISSTERMQTLCVLLGAKQMLTLLSATLEQSTQSCFSCHTMMLCDLLLLIQCTFFSLVWPKQPCRFGRRRNWSRINILTCCRGELMLVFHRQKLEGSHLRFLQD